jgi:pimeloyl-ACP methyl ester carboxylesterase
MKTLIIILMACSILFTTDATANAGSREEFVHEPIFGSKIYFYESGKQHTKSVVLIHGVGDEGARIWMNLVPELEKQFHVVAFDLPGLARSSKGNQLYSPANFSAFVNWIVKKYTNGPVVVIGHSLGGAISLYYADTYPENLERLIVVDVAGILYRAAFIKNFINVKPNKFLDIIDTPASIVNNFIISGLDKMDKDLTPEKVDESLQSDFLSKILYRGDPTRIASMILLHTDFSKIINKINVPVLVVWGEKDPVTPLRTGRLLEWMISESDLRIMPELGHCPMYERPDDFNKIIMDWLLVPVKRKEIKNPLFTSDRVYICEGRDCVISGGYDRIEVKNSNYTQIVNVTAKHIYIERSIVSIESSYIKAKDIGVKAIDSVVNLSGCSVESDIAILTSRSSIDLAGVKLIGKTAAIKEAALKTDDKSTIIFSISKIKSPFNDGYRHGINSVTGKNPNY